MLFETKKIQLETLSEYLTEARKSLELSREQVAEKTGIKPKFVEALENGRFGELPAGVYVFGFLRQLATLYAVNPDVLIDQYKKERSIQQQLQKKPRLDQTLTRNLLGKFVITPKTVSLVVGLLFVAGTLAYVIWQVSSLNKTPSLTIFQPQNQQIIKTSAVTISGKTDPGVTLTINGNPVFVDDSGDFQEQISVGNGPQDFTVEAKNSFNKSAGKTFTVIGDTALVAGTSTAMTAGVQLQFQFIGPVTLTYSVDGGPNQTQRFSAGQTKVLQGQSSIIVSTTDAGATAVIYNGQNMGVMGKKGENLLNVAFSTEPAILNSATSTPK